MYTSVAPPEQGANHDDDDNVEGPPAGVSESNWKKFQELKKRREKSCKKSTEKRRQDQQRNVINPGSSQIKSQDEHRILKEYGVTASSSDSKVSQEGCLSQDARKNENVKNEAKWKNLKQYIPPNSDEKNIFRKQTEEEIDKAIEKGQFEKAGSLSEQLSTQDFVVKVASAVKGRDFAKRRHEEQSRAQKTKKAKLHWGFEQKERWESKGNM